MGNYSANAHTGGNDTDNSADIIVHDGNLNVGLILSVSMSFITAVFVVVLIIFITVTVVLIKAKSKLQEELQQARATALYDEIGNPPSIIDSNKNIAYVSTVQ